MSSNPLNDKDIDGNTLNMGIDDKSDLFHCPKCDEYVPEDEWNNKRNMCYSCFWGIKGIGI